MAKYLAIFFVPSAYFIILWVCPWESLDFLAFMRPISPSVLFDVFLIVSGVSLLRQKVWMGDIEWKGFAIRGLCVVAIAILCVGLTNLLGLSSPFRYLEQPFLQLLVMAPILEELVFRGVFFGLGEKARVKSDVNVLYNSLLFSLSHVPAIWILEREFHTFIVFQMFYTLALGFICSQSRLKSQGLLSPVLLHFLFNLVFYIAVHLQYI